MRLTENIKSNFRFSKEEIIHLVVSSFFLGFLLSFNDWGGEIFNFSTGIINFVNASLISFLSLVLVTSVQKIVSISKNNTVRYKSWNLGLLLGLIFVLISNGEWLVLLPGGLLFATAKYGNIGDKYEGRITHKTRAVVAFFGPISHLTLAYLFKYLSEIGINNYLINNLITLNLILAITTILPIPQMESIVPQISTMNKKYKIFQKSISLHGFYIFYYSRTFYIFSIILILLLSLGMYLLPLFGLLIIGILLASILSLLYLFTQEL